jgi:hypothetical protein
MLAHKSASMSESASTRPMILRTECVQREGLAPGQLLGTKPDLYAQHECIP